MFIELDNVKLARSFRIAMSKRISLLKERCNHRLSTFYIHVVPGVTRTLARGPYHLNPRRSSAANNNGSICARMNSLA
jgi:hypothetical protein